MASMKMKKNTFVVLLVVLTKVMHAQTITGEYYLQGVMETASGFKLNADSSFEFFFSYGALDRSGKGKWTLQSDSVILFNSDKRPPLDFSLAKHAATGDKNMIIQIEDNNKNILRYVQGFIKTNAGEQAFEVDNGGIAQIEKQKIDSIGLIFTLCPDRYSVFPVADNDNYFVFHFEPWIAEVFFENFELKYLNNTLVGKHPLLNGSEYTYEKE